jgi:hypothetical protein
MRLCSNRDREIAFERAEMMFKARSLENFASAGFRNYL